MALITYDPIDNNEAATPQLFNTRYQQLVDAINGGIDGANITDASVTSSELASNAVTTSKITDDSVTMPKVYNPYAFRASGVSATQALTNNVYAKVILNSDSGTGLFDYNNNYDTTLSRYIVPVTGLYQLNANIRIDPTGASLTQIALHKNGSLIQAGGAENAPAGSAQSRLTYADLVSLVAGDYIEMWALTLGTNGNCFPAGSYFSGHLISTQ